jgi:nucleoside-diphosphate-sugar epimerase
LEEFRRVNVAGTEHLARSAAASGVKRLVYVSSIKVNGESTLSPSTLSPSRPPRKLSPACGGGEHNIFTESDIPNPQDPYGISKWEAEQALHRIAEETGLEVVIVRPPLVYGAGVKGNFAQMLKVLARGIPLPLASVRNLRSLVYVGNLADALIACATHPAAAGQTYLVSDGEDVSTPGLLRQLGDGMGRPARLFPWPAALLKLAGRVVGKADQVERLLGSLQVDSGKIRRELGWTPPHTLQQGLQATAEWYRNAQGR